jgi:hypothetical protein
MRKGITILFFGMLALSAPPSTNRLWGQTEKKDALPDPAVKVGGLGAGFYPHGHPSQPGVPA